MIHTRPLDGDWSRLPSLRYDECCEGGEGRVCVVRDGEEVSRIRELQLLWVFRFGKEVDGRRK